MKPFYRGLLFASSLGFFLNSVLINAANDWPQWRGPDRTDVSKETGLLKQWPAEGPKRVWLFKNAGNGYSGPAIVAGKLFTMGTRDDSEILLALDADTGKDLATEIREYFIPDFSNWKDHDSFEKAFNRLLRDLKAEAVKG